MTPQRLEDHQNQWKKATAAKPTVLNILFPNILTRRQKSVIETFVKERIQNERAIATSN